MLAVGLGTAVIQAIVGLASGSASAFFASGVVANGLYGCVFIGSVAFGRPLAGVFARDMYAFPRRVRDSALFRRTFSIVSLVWGGTYCFAAPFVSSFSSGARSTFLSASA
jgi:Protein of unknown function (DUF3159)